MPLRVALLSDIHAHTLSPDDDRAPSFLATSAPANDPLSNPVAGLRRLIADFNLRADVLLCAGDMGDKASPAAQAFVWTQLAQVKEDLGAAALIGTAGNHDMDSRYKYTDHDAKGALQALAPMFPGLDEQRCDHYWARNFVIIDHHEWRLLLLNSAAYHGAGRVREKEYEHGRVSARTVDAVRVALATMPTRPLNILLCHHHLIKNDEIPLADYSQMAGGDLLLNALGSGNFGDWIVLHGHKHYPRIWYAPGGATAPAIFSAGSFSAKLYPELGTNARNQFYVITFPVEHYNALQMGVCGTVLAWDWIYAAGWRHARPESGIPHRAGFGCRLHPQAVAHTVAGVVEQSGEPYLTWDEVTAQVPSLLYLTPRDQERVVRVLREGHRVEIHRDDDGLPTALYMGKIER